MEFAAELLHIGADFAGGFGASFKCECTLKIPRNQILLQKLDIYSLQLTADIVPLLEPQCYSVYSDFQKGRPV